MLQYYEISEMFQKCTSFVGMFMICDLKFNIPNCNDSLFVARPQSYFTFYEYVTLTGDNTFFKDIK